MKNSRKPSLLIIADFPNWAYYEMQQFFIRNLSYDFEIYSDFLCFNTTKKSKNPINILKNFLNKKKYQKIKNDGKYDIVFYLAFYFNEQMKITWKAKKIVKGIYTEGFPPKNANFSGTMEEFIHKYFQDTDAIVCGTQLITERYQKYFRNTYYATTVKQESLFKRKTTKELNNKKFIIGWTGNPNREFKGFYSHVIPAVKKAQEKYPDIKFKTRFSGPLETLPSFYEDVDIVINASKADAGPSLFGEASMMEVPSISTDVGRPHEVILDDINGYIVNRDIEEIAAKIIHLYENRELLYNMSQRIKQDYYNVFDNNTLSKQWINIFNILLNEK